MEHIFEMSKSNTLRYIIFMFPFHMYRKFKSLITHNFLMNLFIKMISKLRYQWKVRVKRMTLVENKMRVYFLKMIYTYIIDVYLKKKILAKGWKMKVVRKFWTNAICSVMNILWLVFAHIPPITLVFPFSKR